MPLRQPKIRPDDPRLQPHGRDYDPARGGWVRKPTPPAKNKSPR